jgi:sugar lactone lactonase YvrE
MKKFLKVFAMSAVALLAYLLAWPISIQPVSVALSADPGYQGAHAANVRLTGLQFIELGGEVGPEHIAIGPDGKLYAGMRSGNILRMHSDGSQREIFINTGGRPLGMDFDSAGNLIVADTTRGLISISPNKTVTVLVDKVNGEPILFADAVVVAPDGKMYFTDASARFAPKDWGGTFEASVLDLMEGSATGRVLVYNPQNQSTQVVAKGLSFANGIVLTADGQSLLVNETGKFCVWKIAVAARELDVRSLAGGSPAASQARILIANLPGYPDNLMRGKNGKIWLGLAAPRSPKADKISDKPFIRGIVMRLPRALWPIPKVYGHVMAFTEDGNIVADLQDPSGSYPATTAVTETADRLYITSLHAHQLGWMPAPH